MLYILISNTTIKHTFSRIIFINIYYMLERIITILVVIIVLFVVYNLYLDIKDYFYTKNLAIMDIILANKIII